MPREKQSQSWQRDDIWIGNMEVVGDQSEFNAVDMSRLSSGVWRKKVEGGMAVWTDALLWRGSMPWGIAGGKSGIEGGLLSLLFQMEILEQFIFQIVGFDSLWGPFNGWWTPVLKNNISKQQTIDCITHTKSEQVLHETFLSWLSKP